MLCLSFIAWTKRHNTEFLNNIRQAVLNFFDQITDGNFVEIHLQKFQLGSGYLYLFIFFICVTDKPGLLPFLGMILKKRKTTI